MGRDQQFTSGHHLNAENQFEVIQKNSSSTEVSFVKVGFHVDDLTYFLIHTALSTPVLFLSIWESSTGSFAEQRL